MNDEVIHQLNTLIAALGRPLASDELANGWTPEAQKATLSFLGQIRDAIREGLALPDVSSAGRALDHWGVVDGRLLEKLCAFYNHLSGCV